MEDEKRIAALMEELESIKEELRQLKGESEAGVLCEAVSEDSGRSGEEWPADLAALEVITASTVEELRGLDDEMADEMEAKFAEIPHQFNAEVYKGLRKNLEFGLYENEAAFLEVVKEKGLESFAIEDGYDFGNPNKEILPQYAEVHKSKTLEESAYHGTKLYHELNGMLIGDRILGPVGSAIGGAIGSFFGFFAGAAESAEIKRLSRAS